MTTPSHRTRSIRIAAAAAVTTLASANVMPASASAIQDAYYAHTRLCLGLLLSDKPAHNDQCLPNTSANPPANDGSGGPAVPFGVAPAAVVVLPPPPPPPPPVVVPDPVDSSYPESADI